MRTFCSACLAVALIACGRQEAPLPAPVHRATIHAAPASPLVGCYELKWHSARPFRYPLEMPHKIELTNVHVENGRYQIKCPEPMPSYMWIEWEQVKPAEAELTWSTGFAGFVITVPVVSNALGSEGIARTFADVPEEPERARVQITRAPC